MSFYTRQRVLTGNSNYKRSPHWAINLLFQVLHFHAARFRWSVIFNPCYLVKFQECKNWTPGFDSYIHKAQFLIWCNYIIGGRRSLSSEICGKVTYHPLEKRQLQQISAYNISTVRELSQSTRVTDRQPNRITTPRFTEHSLPARLRTRRPCTLPVNLWNFNFWINTKNYEV